VITLALSVFVAALLGSVHCAGMCGSFACLASGGDASRPREAWRSAAAYNGGRLLSYVSLGMLAGAAGAGLDRLGAVAGLTRPATVVAGVLLMLWGLATLSATLGVRLPLLEVPPGLATRIARGVRAVQDRPPVLRGLALGVLTAALPCGWLYAFVATAAAAGSAAKGGLVMAAFWTGTVPMMAAVGLGAQRLLGPARRRLPMLTAVVLVLLGAFTVAGRFVPAAHATPSVGASANGHIDHR
jgi:sulfite exporter TauE/SafE